MARIKVVINGALGKMGREVANTASREADLEPVGAADLTAEPGSYSLPDGSGTVSISNSLADVLDGADVVVDFTNADGAGRGSSRGRGSRRCGPRPPVA